MIQEKNIQQIRCWKEQGVFGDFSCPKLADIVHCRNCIEYNRAGRTLFDRKVSDEFLEKWTSNFMGIKEAAALDTISVIVMRIKNEWLVLKTVYLQEITSVKAVHPVPFRTNNVFKGIVNINGELLLRVSLADLLEYNNEDDTMKGNSTIYMRMIVLNKDGERYVFPVDEVLGIYRISLSGLKEPPVTLSKAPLTMIAGIFDIDDKKVGLLDEEKFIHAFERRSKI